MTDNIVGFPQKNEANDSIPTGDCCGTCTAFYPKPDNPGLGYCRRHSPSVLAVKYVVKVVLPAGGPVLLNGRPPDTIMELETIDTFWPIVKNDLHCQEFKKKDENNAD